MRERSVECSHSLGGVGASAYFGTSEREKISFHQLNKKTGHRIKYQKVDAESGDEVKSADNPNYSDHFYAGRGPGADRSRQQSQPTRW